MKMSDSAAAAAHGHEDHGHGDEFHVHAHVSSAFFYIGILFALLILTGITVGAALIDFGSFNTVIAVGVATIKASLVAAFFMHLRHDKLFNTLAFLASFLFLAIFLLLTSDDLWRRAEVDETYGGKAHNVFTAEKKGTEAEEPKGAEHEILKKHDEPKQ